MQCTLVAESQKSLCGRGIAFNSVNISAPILFLGPVTAGWIMPARKSLKTAVVWLSLSNITNTSPESELHIQVLEVPSAPESPQSGLKIEAVLWNQCMQRSPSQWEVSMHKHPLLGFVACLFSSVFSPYTATLPYIVKSSVLLQKQTERSLWLPWS